MADIATLRRQCWLFAVGSSLFAVGTAPGFTAVAGSGATNALCFVGSWFFTTAAWMQLRLSERGTAWWSSAIQFAGTILFNVSTGARCGRTRCTASGAMCGPPRMPPGRWPS